ncbi:MAG: Transcription-repair coupling factor [Parcubacteria group bacterium GW2011_GWA2_46_39]|nr:MAG: Transcription-repair coupling factor [Parcubacteria group bacterium GW2011_GWA2_46_39]
MADHFSNNKMVSLKIPFNLTALTYLAMHLDTAQFPDGQWWFLNNHKEKDQALSLLKFWQQQLRQSLASVTYPESFFKFQTLPQPRGWLLGSSDHLSLPLPTPEQLASYIIKLNQGDKQNPLSLLKLLDKIGYQPGPLPDAGGWYLKRGGLVDLVVTPDETYHLEFTGNIITSIKKTAPITGELQTAAELAIPPLTLKPTISVTAADYLTPPTLLFCPPDDLVNHKTKTYKLLSDPFHTGQAWLESTPLFGGRWEDIRAFIKQERAAGNSVCIYTAEPIRTKRYLETLAKSTTVIPVDSDLSPLLQGFRNQLAQATFLTDHNIAWQQKTYGTAYVYLPLDKLKRGDYLVHVDHGIGKFVSLTAEAVVGKKHDYFLIEYSDNDKLFVPVENADRLSRYIGQPHPKLHRLHGTSWYQVTKRVKAEAGKAAKELLELYAKRSVAKLKPWQRYADEQKMAASFPWPLTSDQLKAWAEISADLERETPMDRLICGDVGFGKTELAVRASFRAALNQKQVALLAPTTILAQQHYDTFTKRFKSWPIKIELLSRVQDASVAKKIVARVAAGDVDIVIGTHRLLSKDISIPKLGLLIVDEEQRFGVKQKEILKKLKPNLHVLSLSATPIPRTLHITLSDLRDLSLITTPPWGRKPIMTTFSPRDDKLIRTAITSELTRGGQIYYLVNRIIKIPAAQARLYKLLPKLKIGVAHGRLPEKDLTQIMHDFDTQKINLLLATTIIENGLDLPNVNTLIVEESENFGLSDLYQLRGRVGRNDKQAFAYFFFNHQTSTPMARKRLAVLAEAKELGSGLQVALKDMELRGAGSILGTEQHGQIAAVGLHLYSRLIAQAIAELKTGEVLPEIPEVTLRLPLEGRIDPELVPDESARIKLYHKLANIRSRDELKAFPEALLGRELTSKTSDQLLNNLLTVLELKLLAENARLTSVSCHVEGTVGHFEIVFMRQTTAESLAQLLTTDDSWKFSTDVLRADHPVDDVSWINWLRTSLELLGK